MSSTKSRIALAAVMAALSVPAFADDAPAFSSDPTWPAIEHPAPAVSLRAQGGEAQALVRADATWPVTDSASPAIALVPHPDDSALLDPAPVNDRAPTVHYAIELAPKADRVAAAR